MENKSEFFATFLNVPLFPEKMAEVYIIHGRNSDPSKCWFPWLAEELRKEGVEVHVPQMPNCYFPVAADWAAEIAAVVGNPNPDKFFVTHSLGGLALFKYFQAWGNNEQYGGAVMVAPFQDVNLEAVADRTNEWIDAHWFSFLGLVRNFIVNKSIDSAIEWTKDTINWERARNSCKEYKCLFSDNDYYVAKSQWQLFAEQLEAECFYLTNAGHIGHKDRWFTFPQLKEITLDMILG